MVRLSPARLGSPPVHRIDHLPQPREALPVESQCDAVQLLEQWVLEIFRRQPGACDPVTVDDVFETSVPIRELFVARRALEPDQEPSPT